MSYPMGRYVFGGVLSWGVLAGHICTNCNSVVRDI